MFDGSMSRAVCADLSAPLAMNHRHLLYVFMNTLFLFCIFNGSGQLSRYSDSLRAGRQCRWWRDLADPSRPPLGPTKPPIHWVSRLPPGQSDWGVASTAHSHLSAEVEERVELCMYSRSEPSWPVVGWKLTFSCEELNLLFYRFRVFAVFYNRLPWNSISLWVHTLGILTASRPRIIRNYQRKVFQAYCLDIFFICLCSKWHVTASKVLSPVSIKFRAKGRLGTGIM